MKRESVRANIHMKRDTPLLLHVSANILDDSLHAPSYVHT